MFSILFKETSIRGEVRMESVTITGYWSATLSTEIFTKCNACSDSIALYVVTPQRVKRKEIGEMYQPILNYFINLTVTLILTIFNQMECHHL